MTMKSRVAALFICYDFTDFKLINGEKIIILTSTVRADSVGG